eukprot:TRINITY_DN1896_c2_g3_i1.p1 TRINITY_DN1896_c2_g3~~TRINITY_DN1896_c2_g3_i1.p1  ORF type:complete len:493 (+),score=42.24 TRINITY_DN1896_c2_g3_i1:45-1523(+)
MAASGNPASGSDMAKQPGPIKQARDFNEPRLSDLIVRLVVPESEEERTLDIHVSKLMLANESDYFRTVCMTEVGADVNTASTSRSGPDGSGPEQKKRKIERVKDGLLRLVVSSFEIGTELLRYPYSLEVSDSFSDPKDLVQLVLCADQYMMTGILRVVAEKLEEKVRDTDEYDLGRLILSQFPRSCSELRPLLDKLVQESALSIVRSAYSCPEGFLDGEQCFFVKPFEVVLATVTYNCPITAFPENYVFGVIQWVQENMVNESDPAHWFDLIIPHVPFGIMSSSFLLALSRIPSFTNAAILATTRKKGLSNTLLSSIPYWHMSEMFPAQKNFLFDHEEGLLNVMVDEAVLRKEITEQIALGAAGSSPEVAFEGEHVVIQGFRFCLELSWCAKDRELQLVLKRLPEPEPAPLTSVFNTVCALVETNMYEARTNKFDGEPRLEFMACGSRAKARIVLGPFLEGISAEEVLKGLGAFESGYKPGEVWFGMQCRVR